MRCQKILLISFCLSLSCVYIACETNMKVSRQQILGDWELVKGFRNKKETESLAGTTFHFGEDGKMSTNLPVGIESPTDFEIGNAEISQKGRSTIKYSIVESTDSSLTLSLEMRSTEFELHLRRAQTIQDSIPDTEELEIQAQ